MTLTEDLTEDLRELQCCIVIKDVEDCTSFSMAGYRGALGKGVERAVLQ